jgi:hypothetical protein
MADFSRDDLIDRIERLEQSYRRWRRGCLAALAAVAALLAVTATSYSQRRTEQPPPPAAKAPPGAAANTPVDSTGISTIYANFFRVTGTPEELILDLGLNTQQETAGAAEPVKLNQRVVLSFFTAKRLLGALQWAVNKYEGSFGVLETDYHKRMQPGNRTPER